MTREEINQIIDKLKMQAETMSEKELLELVSDLDDAIRIVHYRIMEAQQNEKSK